MPLEFSPNRKVSVLFAAAAAALFASAGVLAHALFAGSESIGESLRYAGTLPETPWFVFVLFGTPLVAGICAIILWRLPSGATGARRALLVASALVVVALCFVQALAVAIVFGAPVAALAFLHHRGGS